MATHCFIPVRGKRLRLTTLDLMGNIPSASTADAWLATNGFISVNLTSEIEEGVEIIQRRADGALCVNERSSPSFKRFNFEAVFCGVNPSALAMITNAETYEDYGGDIAGITVAEGEITKNFALELWTGLTGQIQVPGEDEASGYLLLPFVGAGVIGDITVDGENAVNFTVTGASTKGGNQWGVGPYDVLLDETSEAAPLPTPLDSMDHLLLMDTALAPPPHACDPQAMAA